MKSFHTIKLQTINISVVITTLLFLSFILPAGAQKKKYPTAKVSKKGACITTNKKTAENWTSRVKSLNVSWHYSWASRIKSEEPDGVEFVPMIWGFWGENDGFKKNIQRLTNAQKSGDHTHLLGFNEPDKKKQSNLSVEKVIQVWPQLEKTGLRLGSPATVHAHNPWMKKFMHEAEKQKLRVDFVTVHWYGGANPDGLINYLKKIHKMYGKPIWLTEFAVADWQAKSLDKNRFSKKQVYQFMDEVLPKLDKLEFVERYSWFSGNPKSAALGNSVLFNTDGSLTKLGKLYSKNRK